MPPRPPKRSYPSSSSSSSSNPAFPVYNPLSHPQHVSHRSPSPPPASAGGVTVQAYELSLIRGRVDEGREMEERRVVDGTTGGARGRLLKWEGGKEGEGEVWVDRFSHLHLLPTGLPAPPSRHTPRPPPSPSPSEGWSELPSDTEDTFFFSEDEAEDYERDKKRRRLDGLRGGRLAALGGPEEDEPVVEVEVEETIPPPAILTLMRHTSSALLSSPSPRVLELRILANHGADPRFGFMRGKWKETWDALLAGKVVDEEGKVVEKEEKGIGGLLGGYGSDSESESGSEEEGEKAGEKGGEAEGGKDGGEGEGEEEEVVLVETEEEKEEKKKRRKEKALEWAKKRKADAGSGAAGGEAVAVSSGSPPPAPSQPQLAVDEMPSTDS